MERTGKLFLTSALTHFLPLVSFYTPRKQKKTRGFLMFLAGKRDKWHEVSYTPYFLM